MKCQLCGDALIAIRICPASEQTIGHPVRHVHDPPPKMDSAKSIEPHTAGVRVWQFGHSRFGFIGLNLFNLDYSVERLFFVTIRALSGYTAV